MHFDSGKFGAVVVVIALVMTVVIGTCTDVAKVQVERTDYDYITDITGLFETEQVPEYIEYNPNSNYVGYSGSPVYSQSRQPNNYRYVISQGTTTSSTLTINNSSTYPVNNPFTVGADIVVCTLNYTGSQFDIDPADDRIADFSYNVRVYGDYTTSLTQILTSAVDNLASYDTLSIDLSYGAYPVWIIGQTFNFAEVERGDSLSQVAYNLTIPDSSIPTRITINTVTMLATGYHNDTKIWELPSNSVYVLYRYGAQTDGQYDNPYTNGSVTMTISKTTPPVYGYADPKGGVRLNPGSTATWNNGYQVEEITMLIGKYNFPQQSAMYIEFYDSPGSSFNQNLWVSISTSGVDINIYDHQVNNVGTISLGKWTAVEITYNRITGVIMATPVGEVMDYTQSPILRGTPVQLTTGWRTGESVPTNSGFTVFTSGAGGGTPSPYFGVINTTVFLNTYGAVMNDPSIDIEDYWPDLDEYRLNFYSFALVGQSVAINGTTYPVSADQTITVIDAEGIEYTRTLSNIYITTDEGRTYLTFVNDDLTVDLGETVTEVVSFSGLWYFTTALYEVIQTIGYEYEWSLDGTFNATAQQTLVIFLGLLVAGVLVGRTLLHHEFGMLDWVLIVGAGVIALAMSGVFF